MAYTALHDLISVYLSNLLFSYLTRCTSAMQTSLHFFEQGKPRRTALVAQWLRIRLSGASLVASHCLPTRGTQVRALVQEDPTCCGATRPVCHNYRACALEPTSHTY